MEEAKKKENLQFFSEKELILNPEDLVVRADGEIISIAGITETEKINWTEPTKNILLEEVSFEPLRLKKTARRLKFPIPPTNFSFFPPILFRITSLLTESQENSLSSEVVFTYQKHFPKPRLIEVSQPFLEKKIGQKFPPHQIESI